MSTDPFDQLRPVDPPPPDRRFVARLRGRIQAALTDADLPVIDLPERTTTMTDTRTTTATITPYLCVSPATEALTWYRDHLGATETIRYTADDGRIGHAEVTIEGATVMLSDEYPELDVVSPTTLGGTPDDPAPPRGRRRRRPRPGRGWRRPGGRAAEGRGVRSAVVLDGRPVRAPLDDPDADR